jgi:hypothetical protein
MAAGAGMMGAIDPELTINDPTAINGFTKVRLDCAMQRHRLRRAAAGSTPDSKPGIPGRSTNCAPSVATVTATSSTRCWRHDAVGQP